MVNYILPTTYSNSTSITFYSLTSVQLLISRITAYYEIISKTTWNQCVLTMTLHNLKVPQGSVLGPLLLSLCITPFGQIIRSFGIHFHFYADDTKLYVPVKADDYTTITN